jgi:hypothetical protein
MKSVGTGAFDETIDFSGTIYTLQIYHIMNKILKDTITKHTQ